MAKDDKVRSFAADLHAGWLTLGSSRSVVQRRWRLTCRYALLSRDRVGEVQQILETALQVTVQ